MFNQIRTKHKERKFTIVPAVKMEVLRIGNDGVSVSVTEDFFIDPRLEYQSLSPIEMLRNGSASVGGAPRVSVNPSLEDVYNAQQILKQFVSSAEAEAKLAEMVASDLKSAESTPSSSSISSSTNNVNPE